MFKVVSFVLHRFKVSKNVRMVFKKSLECVRLLQIVSDCFFSVPIVFGCFIFSLSFLQIVIKLFSEKLFLA